MRGFPREIFAATQRIGCLGVLCVLLAGCPVPPPRYPIREGTRLQTVISQRDSQLQLTHAVGSLEQFGRGGRLRGNVELYVRRPNRLRVEISGMGITGIWLVSDGERIGMLTPRQEFVVGPARPCVAAQLLGLPLSGSEAAAILTGGAPLLGTEITVPRWENGAYVVDITGTEAGVTERIEFELPGNQRELPADQQVPRVRRVVVRDRDGVRYEVTYQGYRVQNGVEFPDRVRVLAPRQDVDTQVRFDQFNPNHVIPTGPDPDDPDGPPLPTVDPFQIVPQRGVPLIPIDCTD